MSLPIDDEFPAAAEPVRDELPPLTEAEAGDLVRRIVALQAHQEAIRANAEALIRAEQARIDGLLFREGDRLREFLAGRLRGKARSWRCLEGVLGFRAQPARLAVVDEAAALAWAREHRPAAVIAKLHLPAVGKPVEFAVVDEATGAQGYQPPPGFTISEGREALYVKSGARPQADAEDE